MSLRGGSIKPKGSLSTDAAISLSEGSVSAYREIAHLPCRLAPSCSRHELRSIPQQSGGTVAGSTRVAKVKTPENSGVFTLARNDMLLNLFLIGH